MLIVSHQPIPTFHTRCDHQALCPSKMFNIPTASNKPRPTVCGRKFGHSFRNEQWLLNKSRTVPPATQRPLETRAHSSETTHGYIEQRLCVCVLVVLHCSMFDFPCHSFCPSPVVAQPALFKTTRQQFATSCNWCQWKHSGSSKMKSTHTNATTKKNPPPHRYVLWDLNISSISHSLAGGDNHRGGHVLLWHRFFADARFLFFFFRAQKRILNARVQSATWFLFSHAIHSAHR